jgi:hypothetical protein
LMKRLNFLQDSGFTHKLFSDPSHHKPE